ncbi:hypothetical protein BH11PSE12_BH11PSE12_04020 [soil metagenome]
MVEKKTTAKKAPATPKAPAKAVAPPKNPKALNIVREIDETTSQALAREALRPSINAASVIDAFQSNIMGKDADLDGLVEGVKATAKAVNDGDMFTMEAMLVGQATALQTMFTSLAIRAVNQDHLKQYQTCMVLALKAQAQSRATISALVDLKYPKQAATFVKQANIANGPQQVNNGNASASGHTGISTQGAGTHQNTAIANDGAGRTALTSRIGSHQKADFPEQYAQAHTPAREQFSE